MKPKELSPIARAVVSAVLVFVVLLAVGFVKDVLIDGDSFEPHWIEIIVLTIASAAIGYFAPDAAQRKQNRQNLKDSFTKKH